LAAFSGTCSTPVNRPKMFVLIAQPKQSVARIMALAAYRAGNEAAKMHAAAVIVHSYRESCSATARDEKNARVRLLFYDPPLAELRRAWDGLGYPHAIFLDQSAFDDQP